MKMITDNPHLSVVELSKRTGLSRTVFYKWKAGDFDNIQIKSVQAVADATGTNIKIDGDNIEIVDDIVIEKENDMNVEASYIIELQKEKIERLESELKQPQIPNLYNQSDAEIIFKFDIKIKWSITNPGLKVKYTDELNAYVPKMAKKLGYSELEMASLLQIGEMVEYKNHNIHKLRTQEQKEEMLNIIYNFMGAFKKVKMNTSLLIAEIPVKYTAKNGVVYAANVEYRVNWINGTGTAHIRWCEE